MHIEEDRKPVNQEEEKDSDNLGMSSPRSIKEWNDRVEKQPVTEESKDVIGEEGQRVKGYQMKDVKGQISRGNLDILPFAFFGNPCVSIASLPLLQSRLRGLQFFFGL